MSALATAPAVPTSGVYAGPFVPLATPAPVTETGRIEHAGALTAEAEAWVEHATAAGMDPADALRKALGAVGFSIRHRARALAIPSKLRGVAKNQNAVRRLAEYADRKERAGMGLRLRVQEQEGGLLVGVRLSDGGPIEPLGFIQDKHAPWLAPLLAVGATVCLSGVTGRQPGRTMGVNVIFGFVGLAIQARHFQADETPSPSGDDVILRRDRQGSAEVQFSQDGQPVRDTYEWGYGGKGPSCLALGILRQFAGEDDAQRLSRDFLREVVSCVPRAGVRIESRFVRAWITQQTTD